MRVLVVEDHVGVADHIADGLREHGIATDVAYDGTAALQKGLVYRYDVMLFEPFARANQRVGFEDGVGLGLSIADAIARAHAATITARPRPEGGLEMAVTVPD